MFFDRVNYGVFEGFAISRLVVSSCGYGIGLIIAMFWVGLAMAQTTSYQGPSNDALPSCNKLAVYELRQCLSQHAPSNNQHCWTDSHLAYQECHFAMNDRSGKTNVEQGLTKAELKKIQRLSKKARAKIVKVQLMGAANVQVYQQVVERSAENLAALSTLKGVTDKQRLQANARLRFYRQLLSEVDKRASCTAIKQRLSDFAKYSKQAPKGQQVYSRSAYREIKALLPIYCQLLDG